MVEVTPGLRLIQRIQLIIAGSAFTGMWRRPGWKRELQIYAFKCPIHGLVESYHRASWTLRCPKCSFSHANIDHSSRF
jgi:hypothetical protein